MEPIISPNNPVNLIGYSYDNQHSSALNNNTQDHAADLEDNEEEDEDDEEDLSIEIILETSENHSRRRSILSSNQSGLRSADICNIPQKLYSSFLQQLNEKSSSSNTQCVICLEDFQLIDSIKILHCQHIFHT